MTSPLEIKLFGQPLSESELPTNLYIPPDALRILLETFEGPLDLLLYLIRKHNVDILDISMVAITEQYMTFIKMMRVMQVELAADYLLMAATLAHIKSYALLPKQADEMLEDETCADPRMELLNRLKIYEQYRQAASQLDAIPRLERDIHLAHVPAILNLDPHLLPTVELPSLFQALKSVLQRAHMRQPHQIIRDFLSVRERMSAILSHMTEKKQIAFFHCFNLKEGRIGVVVAFIAILELARQSMIILVTEENGSIMVRQPDQSMQNGNHP